MNTHSMVKLVQADVVRGIPKLENKTDAICKACNQEKNIRVQHKKVADITFRNILDLLHMDLMGLVQLESLNGKRYILVVVDDFSIFTWVSFLREKSVALNSFKILAF